MDVHVGKFARVAVVGDVAGVAAAGMTGPARVRFSKAGRA